MPDLAAIPAGAEQRLAADDDASADPDLARNVDEVRRPREPAGAVFGDRREVRVVADVDRSGAEAERAAERLGDGDVAPAQVRRFSDDAGGHVDEPGDGDRDAATTGAGRLRREARRPRAVRQSLMP